MAGCPKRMVFGPCGGVRADDRCEMAATPCVVAGALTLPEISSVNQVEAELERRHASHPSWQTAREQTAREQTARMGQLLESGEVTGSLLVVAPT